MQEQVLEFIKQLQNFQYQLDTDPAWHIIFSNGKRKWYYFRVSYYKGVYYIYDLINNYSLEVEPAKKRVEIPKEVNSFTNVISVKQWENIFTLANEWLQKVSNNWITANAFVHKNYPVIYRKGIVSSAIVQNYFVEFNALKYDVGSSNSKIFCSLVASRKVSEYSKNYVDTMSANTYFDYCKKAYSAVHSKTNNLSGRKLYQTYADNRHEGLLDIDPTSEKEFADWIDGKHSKKTTGGHPWEIMRGGNASNIQLSVKRPVYGDNTKFMVEIYPTGNSRLAETIKMFLAIHKAGLSINIANADFAREQLLSLDNYAIIPEYESLHRANQQFAKDEKISDVLHLSTIKKHQSKILPFITWKPLTLLQPVK
ncbi:MULTISPECIES: hypothetical protein [unclassified Flavobacterium]|uniref:hypothetical protein n=1 Tax=unclassified Flavobacterium TaxID=196869 RepID=UPI00131A9E5A|nr:MULTISPECIES: hypothetical protein [unclassified Flavobacterium]